MTILNMIAIVCGILLGVNIVWTPLTVWIKSKTPNTDTMNKVDTTIDEMTQLRNNLNVWITARMLPGLSITAIDLLEKLKAELLKYPNER